MSDGNKNYRVEHDRDICIGCSACASVCPKYLTMESDGKSDLVGGIDNGDGIFSFTDDTISDTYPYANNQYDMGELILDYGQDGLENTNDPGENDGLLLMQNKSNEEKKYDGTRDHSQSRPRTLLPFV